SASFKLVFSEVELGHGAVRLLADPVVELRSLAEDLAREWPDAADGRDLGRRFHLTVARSADAADLALVEAAVRSELPILGRAEELLLFTRDEGADPRLAGRFRLGAPVDGS